MPEPISMITAIVSSLNTLKSWASDLRQKASDEKNDLLQNIALKIENKTLELERDFKKLAQENESLQRRCDVREKVVFKDGFYYLSSPVQGLSNELFCKVCWERDEKLISIEEDRVSSTKRCRVCGNCWDCGNYRGDDGGGYDKYDPLGR